MLDIGTDDLAKKKKEMDGMQNQGAQIRLYTHTHTHKVYMCVYTLKIYCRYIVRFIKKLLQISIHIFINYYNF